VLERGKSVAIWTRGKARAHGGVMSCETFLGVDFSISSVQATVTEDPSCEWITTFEEGS
jgi:hypothetical protein